MTHNYFHYYELENIVEFEPDQILIQNIQHINMNAIKKSNLNEYS